MNGFPLRAGLLFAVQVFNVVWKHNPNNGIQPPVELTVLGFGDPLETGSIPSA